MVRRTPCLILSSTNFKRIVLLTLVLDSSYYFHHSSSWHSTASTGATSLYGQAGLTRRRKTFDGVIVMLILDIK